MTNLDGVIKCDERQFIKNQLGRLIAPVLALPRLVKRVVALLIDFCLCVLTVWLSYYLRLGDFVSFSGSVLLVVGASVCIALPVFVVAGLYRAIFRYSGWPALLTVTRAIGVYALLFSSIFTVIGVVGVPRTIGIIQPILLLLFVGASRALVRVWLGDQYLSILTRAKRPKVLIYGAGTTGRQLVAAMANSYEMQVIGFLDDDHRLHGHVLNGQPIYKPSDLASLVPAMGISNVLLAMPNLSRSRRNEVLAQIRQARVAVRTLPKVTDLAQGKVSISDLGELDIDDLLGREPVLPNDVLLATCVRGKVVMVTGAGGSIGGELCRQIIAIGPSKLLLLEQNEFALYLIHQELEKKLTDGGTALVPLLASVQDDMRIRAIMSTWHPDTVYHAAAYKHVPLVEHNPAEGVKNNVMGTLRMAESAIESRVSDFVLISTDKAVRPTNIMGASKRLAEMTLQALAATQVRTKFSMVRFGNVLGSSGSVVPKFRQQIRDGGPITLTHPDVTRFFMTIPEAAQLVIQAGAMAEGGDVFVLDMGESVKIIELARRMVELSGLSLKDEKNPNGEIAIEIAGLRPGEKLFEELLIGSKPSATPHPRIMKANEEFLPWVDLQESLRVLDMSLNQNDVNDIRTMLERLVAGYVPSEEIVDWIHMEQRVDVFQNVG